MNNIKILKTVECPLWAHQSIEQARCIKCKFYLGTVIVSHAVCVECTYPIFAKEV